MLSRYTAALCIHSIKIIMEYSDSDKLDSENFKDITTFAFNKSKCGQSAGNQRLYIIYNLVGSSETIRGH
jgi:hypothetical protein